MKKNAPQDRQPGVVRDIISYGGSTFAALVAVSLFYITDEYFIGNFVGRDGLSAMALAFPVTLIFTSLATLVEVGSSAVVSELIGKGRRDEAEATMRGNYLYIVILALVLAALGHLFIEPILRILPDHPSDLHIFDYAMAYLKIVLWGVPFLIVMTLTETFMRCIGKPRHVFFLVSTCALANVLFDILFMVLLGWGMEGAALATLLSEALGSAITVWYFGFSRQRFASPRQLCRLSLIGREFAIGGGFAFAELGMCVTEFLLNGVLLYHNAPELLAAISISNVILSFVYMPLAGLDTGTQPLVSRLYAEGNIKRCLTVCRTGFCLTMALSAIIYLVLMVFPRELGEFFLPEGKSLSDDMVTFLRYTFLLQPCVGLTTWACGIMAALEDEWRNIVVNVVPFVVQVVTIFLLPMLLPIEDVALNYAFADIAAALTAMLLLTPFLRGRSLSLRMIFLKQIF